LVWTSGTVYAGFGRFLTSAAKFRSDPFVSIIAYDSFSVNNSRFFGCFFISNLDLNAVKVFSLLKYPLILLYYLLVVIFATIWIFRGMLMI